MMKLSLLINKSESSAVTTEPVATADPVPVHNDYDDRRHCHQCQNLRLGGYCIKQQFRPVDDIPRRCTDFMGRVSL